MEDFGSYPKEVFFENKYFNYVCSKKGVCIYSRNAVKFPEYERPITLVLQRLNKKQFYIISKLYSTNDKIETSDLTRTNRIIIIED